MLRSLSKFKIKIPIQKHILNIKDKKLVSVKSKILAHTLKSKSFEKSKNLSLLTCSVVRPFVNSFSKIKPRYKNFTLGSVFVCGQRRYCSSKETIEKKDVPNGNTLAELGMVVLIGFGWGILIVVGAIVYVIGLSLVSFGALMIFYTGFYICICILEIIGEILNKH